MPTIDQKPYRKLRSTAISSAYPGGPNWHQALLRMEGAYSSNTIRSYRADFTIFDAWCRKDGRSALPATPETVADFVIAQSKCAAAATINRRSAAIAKIHRLLKLDSPVRTEEVKLATRKVFRKKGRRQRQACGLTSSFKKRLLKGCPDDLRGLRDRALIAVGYDTLCRRAELVQLQIDDLTINADGSGTMLVRKSKADQFAEGRLVYLSAETVTDLQRWLRAARLKTGPIFRGFYARKMKVKANALHPYSVVRILKDGARRAGLDEAVIKKLSGHSMRVGAAQDMAAAGIDLGAIMHAGGWKSADMVMRYIEHMDVQKSGMARLYAKEPLI